MSSSDVFKLSPNELEDLRRIQGAAPSNEFSAIESSAPIDDSDLECFSEIQEVLQRHGKAGRFGVSLLHKHFDLNPTEVLVESTDATSRRMTLEPQIIDSGDTSLIDTQWYLGSSIPLAVVKCRTSWHQ